MAWLHTRASRWPAAAAACSTTRAGSPGGGQVGRDVDESGRADQVGADGVHDGVDVVGTPGLGGVVRAVVVGDDARPVVGGAAGDGVADAHAAADSRHQDGAPRQGQGVAAGRADRSGGAAGTAGAARSGGGVSVMSVGGHAGECRRTVLTYGEFFFRAGAVASGRGQSARPGTGFQSPDASGVPGRPGWSPNTMGCPRRRRLSPSVRGEGMGRRYRGEGRGKTRAGRRLSARCARACGRRPRGCPARTGRSG